MRITEQLAAIPLFASLARDELDELGKIADVRPVPKGAALFSEGEDASGFHVVLSGRVRVYKVSPEGREQTLHLFGPNQPVGEAAAFAGEPFPAHARALEDARTVFIPRDGFAVLVQRHPTVALHLLAVLSKRLMRFAGIIEGLALKEAPARLAAYLLYLGEQPNEDGTVELETGKGQLASLLGMTPETLSRILTKLRSEGAIEPTGQRRFRLLDTALLTRISAGDTRL